MEREIDIEELLLALDDKSEVGVVGKMGKEARVDKELLADAASVIRHFLQHLEEQYFHVTVVNNAPLSESLLDTTNNACSANIKSKPNGAPDCFGSLKPMMKTPKKCRDCKCRDKCRDANELFDDSWGEEDEL